MSGVFSPTPNASSPSPHVWTCSGQEKQENIATLHRNLVFIYIYKQSISMLIKWTVQKVHFIFLALYKIQAHICNAKKERLETNTRASQKNFDYFCHPISTPQETLWANLVHRSHKGETCYWNRFGNCTNSNEINSKSFPPTPQSIKNWFFPFVKSFYMMQSKTCGNKIKIPHNTTGLQGRVGW